MLDISALNPAQREAVTAPEGPVLVIAGAGSGKTRTLVHRLAWLAEQGIAPSSMLLLTFTRKASQEMLHRATSMLGHSLGGVHGGTFHGFAFSVLRQHRPAWATGAVTVMDSADSASALQHCKEALKVGKGDRSFPKTQNIIGLISKARNKELELAEVIQRESPHLLPHAGDLVRLGEAYRAYRREHGLLDYDDLLFELEDLLRGGDDRPGLAEQYRERFQYVMVDEYQDTNKVQARLVRLLTGEDGNVMAVGDDAQSIYAFRGADVRNILDFERYFPSARIIRLEENYRSTQPVLDVANAVLAPAREGYAKTLFTRKDGGEPVRLLQPMSDLTQGAVVARRVESLLEHYTPQNIAVLFRAGYQSYHLEVALAKLGIAFRKYGGLRYAEAVHIKDAVAFARLVINPLDMPSFQRVAALCRGVGPKTAQKIYAVAARGEAVALQSACLKYPELLADLQLVDALRAQSPSPAVLFEQVVEHYRPRLEGLFPDDWPRRLQGLEELTHIASSYTDLESFVADLSLDAPEEETDEQRRVVLSTIHSAKGLEWDAVIVLDLVEDRFPSKHALARPDDFEEERRLMYVACTRAREVLELSAPSQVFDRGTRLSSPAGISPFLRELPYGLCEEWQEGYTGQLTRRKTLAAYLPQSAISQKGSEGVAPAAVFTPAATSPAATCGFCHHKIFGRGKIVEHLPPDKCRVNFPGLGLKVIMTAFLTMDS